MFNRNEITGHNTLPARAHYPWHELEEYQPDGGMWRIPAPFERPGFVEATSELMANRGAFFDSMVKAVSLWPKSCEVALTTPGLNRRAWIGHAGCYLATGSPEETTRLGWHDLDPGEQWGANDAADQAIHEWHTIHRGAYQLGLFDA